MNPVPYSIYNVNGNATVFHPGTMQIPTLRLSRVAAGHDHRSFSLWDLLYNSFRAYTHTHIHTQGIQLEYAMNL